MIPIGAIRANQLARESANSFHYQGQFSNGNILIDPKMGFDVYRNVAPRCRIVRDKGDKMNDRLERRRRAIKDKRMHVIGWTFAAAVALPLALAAIGFAWRVALWVVLS